MSPYELVLDRVELICALLGQDERRSAERVVEVCRELDGRARSEGRLVPAIGDIQLKRELGRLTELLGRRATHALPAATLGRAALADLNLDMASFQQVCADCSAKLQMLGY
jgi:hypothetical protein